MKILFAASEVAPFAKTGGLADVAGSLPVALASLGHDVRVVMPRYRQVDPSAAGLRLISTFSVQLGAWNERCDVFQGTLGENITMYFIGKDTFYDRPELYGTTNADYPDNAERFIFFSRAILELCCALKFSPHIIHCNDWQTALTPLYLKKFYPNHPVLHRTKTIFTVHNLGYQGLFPKENIRLAGLDWDVFTPEGIEFWDRINFLKAGLVYSDIITTVSKTYSREIQTPEYGYGLEGVLKKRSEELYGIINGIDYHLYDPAHDRTLPRTFGPMRLAGKQYCKQTLQAATGLPASDAPCFGMVTRLVDQKGLDIFVDALPEIMALNVQMIILGTGDEKYHRLLTETADHYQDRMHVLLQYNDRMAKNIYAGCDMFLMPSRYEPCGLGQMIALRYGTVPVVRKTGGLADTVSAYDPEAGTGTGFLFEEYSASSLARCCQHAAALYRERKAWKRLMRNGMKQDLSWEHSAHEYVKIYKKAIKNSAARDSRH